MTRRAVMVEVAAGIVVALNGEPSATWAMPFQAERSWADWEIELEELGKLRVDVVPAGVELTELSDRGDVTYQVMTDVGVRFRADPRAIDSVTGRVKVEQLDSLALVSEQIAEFLTELRLPSYESAVWVSTDFRTAYLQKHLRELRQWTAVTRSIYEVTKPVGSA